MTHAKVLYNTVVSKLSLPESAEEISATVFALLQHLGVSRTDVLADRLIEIDSKALDAAIHRLNQQEPLQYIFNEAWFYGRKFFVDDRVLIPRPETELLIELVKRSFKQDDNISVLDIGTGSGCIAITLALEFPNATVRAMDISIGALQVAEQNAKTLGATVTFIEHDILRGYSTDQRYDLIVSNPPYIAQSEKSTLPGNVVRYEPHLALFATEEDPLIFYRVIGREAFPILRDPGILAVEINERLAIGVSQVFEAINYSNIQVYKDIFGKDRVVTARGGIKNAPFRHN